MRTQGWKERLFAEVDAARTRDWEWSKHDCLSFSARAVLAMTGTDYAAPFSYDSEETAQAILDEHGGVAGLLTSVLGYPVSANEARVGDIVTANVPSLTAGVCLGPTCAFALEYGIAIGRRELIVQTWRVE